MYCRLLKLWPYVALVANPGHSSEFRNADISVAPDSSASVAGGSH